jgi:hypothetical protein
VSTGQFWIYVVSVLLSPLIAVQVTEFLRKRREKRERRFWIYRTLMATRSSVINPDHVRALSAINVEFHDKKSAPVMRAWKEYALHLNTPDTDANAWLKRSADLLAALLSAMGDRLGIRLDPTDVKLTTYFPRGLGEADAEWTTVRRGLAKALDDGKQAIRVVVEQQPEPRRGAEIGIPRELADPKLLDIKRQ